MSRRRQIVGATGIISSLTLLSRILGVVRDSVIAARLGASELNEIFQIAFTIPNLARRVLGEGALSAFIVPVVTGVRHREGDRAAWRFTANALNLFVVMTALLTLVGLLFSKQLFLFYGGANYALTNQGELVRLGARLTAIMFPYLMLLTLVALCMGILHSLKHFTFPAMGSAAVNIVVIGAALIFYKAKPERFVYILAWAVLASAVVRLALMIPPLVMKGFRWRPVFNRRDPHFKELMSKMPGGLGIAAVAQVNIAVMLNLANWAQQGAIVYLQYSQRLIQLPMALFSTALSTALLPQLSSVIAEDNRKELREIMIFAFRALSLVSFAAAIGLIALARPIVQFLFERGNWTAAATHGTAVALSFYAIGLVALDIQRILIPVYYAQKDMITPVKFGARAMALNIVLSATLVFTPLDYAGLALASSVSQSINSWMLWRGLTKRYGGDLAGPIGWTLVKAFACAALMGLVCHFGYNASERLLGAKGTLEVFLLTIFWVMIGITVYAAASRLAGLWDQAAIRRLLRR